MDGAPFWIIVSIIGMFFIVKFAKMIIESVIVGYEVRHEIRSSCPLSMRHMCECTRKPFSRKGKKECDRKKAEYMNVLRTPYRDFRQTCPECHGTGRYNGVTCDRCGGTGKLLV